VTGVFVERQERIAFTADAWYNGEKREEITMKQSEFDGGLLQFVGWVLLGSIITGLTFGIAFPWAIVKIYEWEAKHTVIDGTRLTFDGNAVQLFGLWIKWLLLIIITPGIYSFWVQISLKKWRVSHTHAVV
jgi:uncharacterized membrane protein YjgN (DUF898 family)